MLHVKLTPFLSEKILLLTRANFRGDYPGGDDPEERSVLVKVVVSKDDAVRDAIIRATNNQTSVELASLHATDKIQRDIEDILFRKGLFYERRKNYYVNLGHSPQDIVTPLYLASGYVSLVLKHPQKATLLRSKFMRSPEAYDEVFSINAPIEVWPQIAAILKITDKALEDVRPTASTTDRFLKNWRYMVSFGVVSLLLGKFDFSNQDLMNLNINDYSEQKVADIWYWLNTHFPQGSKSSKWTSRNNVLAACKELELEFGVTGYRTFEARIDPVNLLVQQAEKPSLTEDFISRVKALLPQQPWKPGIHRSISTKLDCNTSLYFAAVDALIEEGYFYRQRDGVLYDPEGNVVSFDPDRVNPETMMLRST